MQSHWAIVLIKNGNSQGKWSTGQVSREPQGGHASRIVRLVATLIIKALAKQLVDRGIRVNAVAPGSRPRCRSAADVSPSRWRSSARRCAIVARVNPSKSPVDSRSRVRRYELRDGTDLWPGRRERRRTTVYQKRKDHPKKGTVLLRDTQAYGVAASATPIGANLPPPFAFLFYAPN